MNIYLAPMEGITGYVFRNAINKIYGGIDKYFTPFIVPTIKREFKTRELRDILPENNQGMKVVPQILSNDIDGFMNTLCNLKKYGYTEVNLNLGCPSGTVVSKGKGAGALRDLESLDKFLDGIYSRADIAVSIKTRIGMDAEEEWIRILEIYNKYPVSELIIHPRLREDYYKKPIHMNCYDYAYKNSRIVPCYNGDISSGAKYDEIVNTYKDILAVMIGRGLIEKPYLARAIKNADDKLMQEQLFRFHNELFEGYLKEMQEENNVLHKMKEMWFYFGNEANFTEDDLRLIKKLKKSKKLTEYMQWIEHLKG